MKAGLVHETLRSVLSPWLKAQGFKRMTGTSWRQPRGSEFFVLWFQISSGGFDPYAGGSFTMELQISPLDRIGAWGDGCTRERLPRLLSDEERERAVEIQNSVRAKLELPPPEHWIWTMRPEVIASYQPSFGPIVDAAETRHDDFWLQYLDEADVQAWAEFILGVLPNVAARLEAAHQEKR